LLLIGYRACKSSMALSSKRFPRLVAGSYSLLLYLQIRSSRIRFVFYAFFW